MIRVITVREIIVFNAVLRLKYLVGQEPGSVIIDTVVDLGMSMLVVELGT